jgi:plastocyanin
MPRRSSRRVGSRALVLIVVAIGLQLSAAELAAATAQDQAPPDEASVTDQLAAEQAAPDPSPAAAASASVAPAQPAPSSASSSVTVSRAKASSTRSVSIVDFAFDPTAVTVKVGDTVQWINNGTAEEGHNVVDEDFFQSQTLHTGDSFGFTFDIAGTYNYVCTLHPKMTGTVEVIDPNADEPKPKKKGNKSSGKRGSASAGTSGDGGGSSAAAAGSATGRGSESAAGRSADAAGTSGSLPSTGSRSLSLGLAGLALLAVGLALRTAEARRLQRRS